jgi:transposase
MQNPAASVDFTKLSVDTITPETLAGLIARVQNAEVEARLAKFDVSKKQHTLTVMGVEIESLKLQIAKLRRMHFGSRSEQLLKLIGQMELDLEELETREGHDEADLEQAAANAGQSVEETVSRRSRKRKAIPEHLPRQEVRHEAPGVDENLNCTSCGSATKHIGDDVSEQLEYQPAVFTVIRHVRPKFGCACCGTISQAPSKGKFIEKGIAGAALLAHVAVSKYCDHQPLYRQSEIYARQGVELERATLANWMGNLGFMLTPVVDAIRKHVFEGPKIHADDTTMPTLKPGNKKTLTGRLWTYVRNDANSGSETPPAMWFAYSDNRRAENPAEHLQGYSGLVQCDAYAGYNGSFEQNGIAAAFCWAHARRKFFDLAKQFKGGGTNMSQQAIERIAELYAIEKEIRGLPPDERLRIRQAQTVPKLDDFRHWALDCIGKLSKTSQTAEAFKYVLKRWDGFIEFSRNGHLEIDNNWAENSVRPIALGRKNFLFVGSENGGQTAANLYTLIGTAKANDLDPFAYLRHVITCIADGHKINEIDQLLPWNVKAALAA